MASSTPKSTLKVKKASKDHRQPSPCPSSGTTATTSSTPSSVSYMATPAPFPHQITSQLLNSIDWLQFNSRCQKLKFIDDNEAKSSSLASTLTKTNTRILTIDHATAIAEGRRVINEEASALRLLGTSMIGTSFAKACELIVRTVGRIIVSGLSKGGHTERKAASALAQTGSPAFFLHPDDLAYHGELDSISEGDVFVILSATGIVSELLPAILRAERLGVPIIAITARKDSQLGEVAQVTLEIPDVPEAYTSNALPTVSTHCMAALGEALAICTQRARRGLPPSDIQLKASKWRLKSVKDVMSTDPFKLPATVLGSSKMTDAIPKLLYSHAGLVGVINDQGQLVDALTDADIRLLANNSTLGATVEEALVQANTSGRVSALTLGYCVLLADEQACEAVIKMSTHGLRGAFVINETGMTVGYLSLADCLEAGILPTAPITHV